MSKIPENGPYIAYIGNLPYEANEDVITEFFCKLDVCLAIILFMNTSISRISCVTLKQEHCSLS